MQVAPSHGLGSKTAENKKQAEHKFSLCFQKARCKVTSCYTLLPLWLTPNSEPKCPSLKLLL